MGRKACFRVATQIDPTILSRQCNGCIRFAHRKPSRVDRIKLQSGSHLPPALWASVLSFSLSSVLLIVNYYSLKFLKMQVFLNIFVLMNKIVYIGA